MDFAEDCKLACRSINTPVAKACLQNDFIQEAMKYSTNLHLLESQKQRKVIVYHDTSNEA